MFEKGKSGNPNGRPKVDLAWRDRCRQFMESAGGWEELSGMALDKEHSSQLPALKVITEYAYGKPTEHKINEFAGDDPLEIVIRRG
jgi:hypothetical protein